MPNTVPRTTAVPLVVLLSVALAGCALPRGAGLQSEVLAAAAPQDSAAGGSGTVAESDFAVHPVTRDTLARYAAWPGLGPRGLPWINRQPQEPNRIIAAGDTVSVTVWNTEENSLLTSPGQRFVTLAGLRVSSTGTVFLPYVGDMRIEGMSPERARAAIEERFVEITPAAQVQLDLVEGRQSTVSLVEGVARPGPYPLPDQDYTILSLLAAGGGASSTLRNPQVRLMRGGDLYGIGLDDLLADPARDTTLRGGDRIYVEDDDRRFLSLGAAGAEAQHDFTGPTMTALEALAEIGGVNDNRADPQGVLVLRQYPASAVRADGTGPDRERVVFTIDLTSADGLFSAGEFLIQPDDLIYVTESPLVGTQSVLSILTSGFAILRQIQ